MLPLLLAALPLAADARPDEPPLPPGAVRRLGPTRFRTTQLGRLAALTPDGAAVIHTPTPDALVYLDAVTGRPLRTVRLRTPVQGGTAMTFTPDGRRLAVAQYDALVLLDPATGEQVARLHLADNAGEVRGKRLRDTLMAEGSFGIAADGSRIAVGTRYQSGQTPAVATVVETATGAVLAEVTVLQQSQIHAVLSADGRRLATFGQHYVQKQGDEPLGGVVQVWDVATSAEVARVRTGAQHTTAAAFARDGGRLFTAGQQGPIQAWELPAGLVAAGGAKPGALPPDRVLSEPAGQFATRSTAVSRLIVAPDGSRLAGASSDGSVQVWDVGTGRSLGRGGLQVDRVADVAFPPNRPAVVLGTYAQTLQLWTVPGGPITPQTGHLGPVTGMRFAADGRELLTLGGEGRAVRWDVASGREADAVGAAPAGRRAGAASRSYSAYNAVVGSDAGTVFVPNGYGVAVIDADTGEERHTLFFPGMQHSSVSRPPAVSADGRRVAATAQVYAGNKQEVVAVAWDADTGRPRATVRHAVDPQRNQWVRGTGVAVSPDGAWLVAGVLTNQLNATALELTAVELATGARRTLTRLPTSPNGYGGAGLTLHVAPDGRSAVIGTDPGRYVVWDLPSGRTTRTFDVPGGQPHASLHFSPDGRLVAVPAVGVQHVLSSQRQAGLRVIEWASGGVVCDVPTGDLVPQAAAFSPDGRTLAVGWPDATVLLFDLADKQFLSPPAGGTTTDRLWEMIATGPAREAAAAVRDLAARPAEAVDLLRAKVKSARRPADPRPGEVADLVARLDAPRFADRARAERALAGFGRRVEPELRAAVAAAGSAEVRRRLDTALEAVARPPAVVPAEARAVEVLERAGTPEAKAVLASWAAGGPDATLTRGAAAALARLGRAD